MLNHQWLASGLVLVTCLVAPTTVLGADGAGEKPLRTVISGEPWVPRPAGPEPKVIYGTDDRIDLYEETDPDRRAWAAATCGLVSSSDLVAGGGGSFTLRTSNYNVCAEEPFSNQPTASFCSGFMVGDDLIATAGHCYDSGDLSGVRFVFGFVMEDANTPVLSFDADQVYRGVEIVGRALGGDLDYAVIRVDRPIVAPGAVPFEIRREGVIAVGAGVGVIGHPSGLPMKIAFGANTTVRSNSNNGYFVANLDTYGGNSGSPVINPLTGVIEGILVRGETDFISSGNCLVSNVVGNGAGRGEDVSKTSSFMHLIPELISGNGSLSLDRDRHACGGTVGINLSDMDLAGQGTATVVLTTSGGDSETVVLNPGALSGEFEGEITLAVGAPVPGNGTLEAVEGETLTAAYDDEAHGPESPDIVTASSVVDCSAPVISNVEVLNVGAVFATVRFSTSEPATGRVVWGDTCGALEEEATSLSGTEHAIQLQSLLPLTAYAFRVEAFDVAGNPAVLDNGGACFELTTAETTQYYTQIFPAASPDLVNTSLTFSPRTGGGYGICRQFAATLPVPATGATTPILTDDGFVQVQLSGGATVPYYGVDYDRVFVNANGNVTFTSGDSDFDPSRDDHFAVPRVSVCFSDLDPSFSGAVWHRQLNDRLAITWQGVPHFSHGGANTMQVELFFDGTIRMTWTSLSARPAIVGLSGGQGNVTDFTSTDLSAQVDCGTEPQRTHSADSNGDYAISLQETLRVIQFYNLEGYHCDASGEDGFAPGPGDRTCVPHDTDYNNQDWVVSMSEVLRVVQIYNAGGYSYNPDAGTEDGFVPGLAR